MSCNYSISNLAMKEYVFHWARKRTEVVPKIVVYANQLQRRRANLHPFAVYQ